MFAFQARADAAVAGSLGALRSSMKASLATETEDNIALMDELKTLRKLLKEASAHGEFLEPQTGRGERHADPTVRVAALPQPLKVTPSALLMQRLAPRKVVPQSHWGKAGSNSSVCSTTTYQETAYSVSDSEQMTEDAAGWQQDSANKGTCSAAAAAAADNAEAAPKVKGVDHVCEQDPAVDHVIHVQRIMRGEETRLTVMLRNLPSRLSVQALLKRIENAKIKVEIEDVSFPTALDGRCKGFAFITLQSSADVVTFYRVFHGCQWATKYSVKVSAVVFAKCKADD